MTSVAFQRPQMEGVFGRKGTDSQSAVDVERGGAQRGERERQKRRETKSTNRRVAKVCRYRSVPAKD